MGASTSTPACRVIETRDGKIQGQRLLVRGNRQVEAFQGIPYAAPPIGPLRFKKPTKAEKWDVVRQCKAFCPPAVHSMEPHTLKQTGSEDCLYLNVFAPTWEPPKDDGFPVMCFIHGGAFEMGDAPTYGDVNICENIVPDDVIFVTIQYRLGYLGFFSTGDEVCPGNIGLWDMTAALTWVRRNIEAFGGNKRDITLLGLSAGAASVEMLHLSPHSTKLFHKAIIMAGSAECRWAMNQRMPEQCRRKAEHLGVTGWKSSEELLEKLRAIAPENLAVIYADGIKGDGFDFETAPLIDGDFFPAPLDELRSKAAPKPFVAGVTKEEGLLFILDWRPDSEHLHRMLALATQDATTAKDELEKSLRDRYVGGATPATPEPFMRAIARLASDYYVCGGIVEACRKTLAVQKNHPVYLYVLEHCNDGSMGENEERLPYKDCTHTSEVQYLFGKGRFATPVFTEADTRVTRTFTRAFTNFAKSGNPNGAGDEALPAKWEPLRAMTSAADVIDDRHLIFDAHGVHMKDKLFEGRTAEFVELMKKHK